MIRILLDGQYGLFFILLFALIFSLSFHEFGHAFVAKKMGDNTAERAGRLTLNPLAHIDPLGMMMVILIGFGYAKPVPTDPRNFKHRWADFWVSAAGPGMNLVLAFISINVLALALNNGWDAFTTQGAQTFFVMLAVINLILMLFNLIPIGSLDGHYMLPYFLPSKQAYQYRIFNAKYGDMILLSLIALSFVGVPIFRYIFGMGYGLLPFITIF